MCRSAINAFLLWVVVGTASAACDLPVKINPKGYGAADVNSLRIFSQAVENRDTKTIADFKAKGLVHYLPAGTSGCADPTSVNNAFYRIRVTLTSGESVWMNENDVSKVGWGGL